ncbi:Zinc finger C3HC4 type (RING finger) protein [Novymonas esmeraldas]|uniref:Zinc finger C3HC4 type (RING finger) protein n=1 Tax=Novymonas esmeraldas TaxID=1808958 RepID=A0AAW0EXA7_9TRYP
MPKAKKGGGRGTVVKNLWDITELQGGPGADDGGGHERSSASTTSATYRRPRPVRHVDPAVLKRSFMLQNFQFILRADLLSLNTSQGLPQGQRRLAECIQLSDVLVPWEVVHAVVMRTTPEEFQCPICMEMPTAPRITECGHVYCLPCILQYMSRQKAAGAPRTCPMCHDLLTPYALRPCVLQPVQPLKVGVVARFDLFKRHRNSCVLRRFDDTFVMSPPPPPPTSAKAAVAIHLPTYMDPGSYQSRYVMATPQYEAGQRCADGAGISERMRELEQLSQPLGESDAEVERFLLEALNEVSKEPKGLPPSMLRNSPVMAPRPAAAAAAAESGGDYLELYADGDGQPFYLHMLTVKMLKHDAKVRGAPLPDTVTGVIEEVVTMEQTEETRHIYKVFSHVPLHGTIKLCVLNVDGLVMPETRAAFASALQRMSNDRAQRRRHDDRAASEDVSWKQYLMKYSSGGGGNAQFSPDTAPSDFSIDTESLPYLQLPSTGSMGSDHGLPPNTLDTRQRATKRLDLQPLLVEPTGAPTARGDGTTAAATAGSATPTTSSSGTVPASSCWARGSAAMLFAKAERTESTPPTWGGHVFQSK